MMHRKIQFDRNCKIVKFSGSVSWSYTGEEIIDDRDVFFGVTASYAESRVVRL